MESINVLPHVATISRDNMALLLNFTRTTDSSAAYWSMPVHKLSDELTQFLEHCTGNYNIYHKLWEIEFEQTEDYVNYCLQFS